MMDNSKKHDIMDKCEYKFDKYKAILNCAYIGSRSSDILYYTNCIAKLICAEAGSAKNYDEIMDSISEEVARLLQFYTEED